MDHYNSNPSCSKVNHIQSFQLSEQLIWKVLSQFTKRLAKVLLQCQVPLHQTYSRPLTTWKKRKRQLDKHKSHLWDNTAIQKWIPNSHESAMRKCNSVCTSLIYTYFRNDLVLWNNFTLGLTNSALLLNTCQVWTAGQGWNNLMERQGRKKKKKKLVIYHWRHALWHIQKAQVKSCEAILRFSPNLRTVTLIQWLLRSVGPCPV